MDYKVRCKASNIIQTPHLKDVALDGEIGARFDRFIYHRVSGDFAIDFILKEAEDCFRDKFDDERCFGMWRCEFWGKLILSAVRICRMRDDNALKENIKASVYRLLQYQDESGYLGTYLDGSNIFPPSAERCKQEGWVDLPYNWNVWGQKYTLWGLLESAMLLDDPHILTCCEAFADQLLLVLENQHARLKEAGVMDGMPACSILKPMLLLYRLSGSRKYYDFCLNIAAQWEREDGERPNLITNGLSSVSSAHWYPVDMKRPNDSWIAKAYEMMSCYDGLIELYRVSGDLKYLEATKCFWDSTKRDEENILGSVGYCERFADAASYLDSATEVCDAIHWMRLSHELFCLTGEAKYMEAFEKAYLNAFLAGVYEDGTSGAFFVRSAGRHQTASWQVGTKHQHCCVNNAGRGFVNAAESIITRCENGYYVNLYTASCIRFDRASFRINNGYIDSGIVSVTVRGTNAGEQLYLRIPSWSPSTKIDIISSTSCTSHETTVCGSYYVLPLSGENLVVRLTFDMTPEIIDFPGRSCHDLPLEDYHVTRWIDGPQGLCNRKQMTPHAMSILRRGPVLLARSKRVGCTEAEMFSGETVYGKSCSATATVIKHDRFLTACRVNLTCDSQSRQYIMCDFASAANRDSEDPCFFSVYI